MAKHQPLVDRRFMMFVGDTYEDLELWYPKLRLTEAGRSRDGGGAAW